MMTQAGNDIFDRTTVAMCSTYCVTD